MRCQLAAVLALLAAMAACGGDSGGAGDSAEKRPSRPAPSGISTAAGEHRPATQREPETPAETASLNLLLITVDTTRADALGAYGQVLDTSPNLDHLAAEGVLFEQAVSSTPQTLPSHSTLFTGKYPYSHGVRSNTGYVLSMENVTLAEVLRDAGYATGAEIAALVLQESTQVTQGFQHYRGPESPGVQLKKIRHSRGGIRERELPVRVAADISRRGIEFIRSHRDQKFFLWLHYFDPHSPYSAPGAFNAKIPESPYHAEVASADFQIGRVIDELARLQLSEKTLLVVTSDHGEGLGDHGELTHSYFVYQSTMHVPLIFEGPGGLLKGLRVAAPVRIADIAPTILDLLGLPPLEGVQGKSLRPLLVGDKGDLSLAAYGESIELRKAFGISPLRFLREGRWKYIHKVNPELYDLERDPGEEVNLAQVKPEVVERLRSHLRALLAQAGPPPDAARVPVDDQTRDQLAALGYATGGAPVELGSELAEFELSGVDASAKVEDVERLGRTEGFLEREEHAQALDELRVLRERNPDSALVLAMTSTALAGLGRDREAAALLARVIELAPRDLASRRKLAGILEKQARGREAVDVLSPVLDLGICDDVTWSDLNRLLHSQRRYTEQRETLGKAVELCPDSTVTLNNYAWLLATSPDESVRDGAKAVATARSAIAQLERKDPDYLDTLAAAHAEAGEFAEAVRVESAALQQLQSAGAPEADVSALRQHLTDFEAGRAIRDPG